jgi:hypothetical protein
MRLGHHQPFGTYAPRLTELATLKQHKVQFMPTSWRVSGPCQLQLPNEKALKDGATSFLTISTSIRNIYILSSAYS